MLTDALLVCVCVAEVQSDDVLIINNSVKIPHFPFLVNKREALTTFFIILLLDTVLSQ